MSDLDVKNIRKNLKLSQSELASKIGVSLRTIQNWEAGEKIPKTKHEILRNFLFPHSLEDEFRYKFNEPSESYKKSIPLIPADAMAGFGSGQMQVMDYDAEKYIVPEFTELKTDFMIRVKGSSMYPKYNSGDIVACKKLPLDTFFQWNKVYVLDTIQGPMIKRIHTSEKMGFIKCVSDNEKYKPFDISIEDIYSLSLVVGVIRFE